MKLLLSTLASAVALCATGANSFRVTPYVQHPKPDAMTVMWLAQTNGPARVEVWKDGSSDVRTLTAVERTDLSANVTGGRFTDDDRLQYCLARELAYDQSVVTGDNHPSYTRENANAGWSMPYTVPWQYRVRLTGLEADTVYRYRVTLDDGGATYENRFRTSPDPEKWRGFKFIYYSDSETEPADNDPTKGLTTDWDAPDGMTRGKTYHATQTEAYASNICAAVDFGTELIVMAGDLAQKGSRQCDWDEFWRHNAGPLNDPAGSIPVLASPGNHDYYAYEDGGVCGSRKYLSYFEYEPNGTSVDADQQERFHRVDYGPVTFIFLDGNNGNDADITKDTNLKISRNAEGPYRVGIGCRAPDFNPGTPQYAWLEAQLADAQRKSAFTFIVTHQCPFSVGDHGREPGDYTDNTDFYSGRPLRVLLPLMHKYGVDGWFAGHDEMMERSVTEGTELCVDGTERPHSFFVWDMGIAGDGLRGAKKIDNPNECYRAHVNSQEVWENGLQVEGGKHYGHLEVTIDQAEDGRWRATFDPIYVFFTTNAQGKAVYGGVRHYADKQVRISDRCAGERPAPQPVTKTRVDPNAYVPTKMPQALMTTFWKGTNSRGFAWQTDSSVTETKLWILKGEFDQDDALTFAATAAIDGESDVVQSATEPAPIRCHRVHVDGLEPGATYSYRLGGNGFYAYGRFTVKAEPATVTVVNFNDTQSKKANLLYKAENTIAAAARAAGGDVDLVVFGGDLFDNSPLQNVQHKVFVDNGPSQSGSGTWKHWEWGLMTDLLAPYFPDVPWVAVAGNHDYGLSRTVTAVDYWKEGLSNAGCASVDIGDVHIVQLPFLGTFSTAGVSNQYAAAFAWLKSDLAQTSAKWKVVAVHWGPYTTGDHGTGINLRSEGVVTLVRMLAPVLSAGHVDLVLQAHDPTFSKSVGYRWDTLGYTSSATDETVLDLHPAKAGGFDVRPNATYYVSCGCAGHRAAEEPTYPDPDGQNSYTKRDPRIVMGQVAVKSDYFDVGDTASSDFHAVDPNGRQTFGVLKIGNSKLVYDFYVAEADGRVTLVDSLRIFKGTDAADAGLKMILR